MNWWYSSNGRSKLTYSLLLCYFDRWHSRWPQSTSNKQTKYMVVFLIWIFELLSSVQYCSWNWVLEDTCTNHTDSDAWLTIHIWLFNLYVNVYSIGTILVCHEVFAIVAFADWQTNWMEMTHRPWLHTALYDCVCSCISLRSDLFIW